MNFLNFFRKKEIKYQPQNRLEHLLVESGFSPAARKMFLDELNDSEVFVIGKVNRSHGEEKSASLYSVTVQSGEEAVFAFTSKCALDYALTKKGHLPQNFVALKAVHLFEMIRGKSGVVFNDQLPFGVHFTREEILKSCGWINLPKGTEIVSGIPEKIPQELIQYLKEYVRITHRVLDIVFSLRYYSTNQTFAYYLAVQFEGDVQNNEAETFFTDLGLIVKSFKLEFPVEMMVANLQDLKELDEGRAISIKNDHQHNLL